MLIYHDPARIQTIEVPLKPIRPPSSLLHLLVAGIFGLISVEACSPAAARPAGLVAHPAAEWKGEDQDLFGDSVDVGAFPPPGSAPVRDEASEAKLLPRLNHADGVVLAKFVSVTSEPAGDKERFRLEMVVEGEPLLGKAPPGSPFILVVDPYDGAFGTIRAYSHKLIGQKVVVFYRRFGDDEDTVRNRFHMSAATPELLKFIADFGTKKQFK